MQVLHNVVLLTLATSHKPDKEMVCCLDRALCLHLLSVNLSLVEQRWLNDRRVNVINHLMVWSALQRLLFANHSFVA